MKGLFISFDGIDGSGKGTQIRLLAEQLRAQGHEVLVTHEPGGSPYGCVLRPLLLTPQRIVSMLHDADGPSGAVSSAIEADALTEIFLFMAERHYHVISVIRPALEAGKIVISDRFADSTVVYQGYDLGYNIDTIKMLNTLAVDSCWPELTFFLDLPVEESTRRTGAREQEYATQDRYEAVNTESFQRRRKGYHELAAQNNAIVLLDGSQSEEDIHQQIFAQVQSALKKDGAAYV